MISEAMLTDGICLRLVILVTPSAASHAASSAQEVPVVRLHGIHRGVPLPQIVAEEP